MMGHEIDWKAAFDFVLGDLRTQASDYDEMARAGLDLWKNEGNTAALALFRTYDTTACALRSTIAVAEGYAGIAQ